MTETTRPDITPERVRLLADRLCWLSQGQDGLRVRHGMRRSGVPYRDQFDVLAEAKAAEWLPVRQLPTLPQLPTLKSPLQPTLF